MANTYTVTRGHIIYGITLPLALLLGYLLAEPLDSSSLAVVVLVLSVLVTPLLIKWCYPALILSFNSAFYFHFLPGRPPAWLVLVFMGFTFALLNRCVDPNRRLMRGGQVAWSLIALGTVIVLTALSTGGVGMQVLGSSFYGGRKYLFLAGAVIGYFVLVSRPISPAKAPLYILLFFLPGFTGLLGNLAYKLGHGSEMIFWVISTSSAAAQASAEMDTFGHGIARISGWVDAANAVCMCMLARYGVGGILDFTKPWRLVALIVFYGLGLTAGFRSYAAFVVLVFVIAFFLEGLHRTKRVMVVVFLGMILTLCVAGFARKMPLSIQRAISFLPIDVDPAAAHNAQTSSDWRYQMWKHVIPEVPHYLLKGKGYTINPNEMAFAQDNAFRTSASLGSEWAIVSGDYHNGPLSVVVPFGIWGVLAFGWFLYAAGKSLYRNCLYGRPELRVINRALFACFLARAVFFIFLVGGFHADLPYLVFLVGLGESMNRRSEQEVQSPDWEMLPRPERV